MTDTDEENLVDLIVNNPNLRMRIREKALSQKQFKPREMTDTSKIALPNCAFAMYSDSRRWCEWFLFMFSLTALLVFGWVDFYMLQDIRNRLIPYSVLIDHDQDRNNTQLQQLKSIKIQNAESIMLTTVCYYPIVMILRLLVQGMIIIEDRETGSEEPRSSLPLIGMWWMSHLVVFFVVLFGYWETTIFVTAAAYSGDILSDKMNSYAMGDEDLKVAIDRFQMNYECCGSGNYTDWYRVDLYQFPDLVELEYDDPMREYFVGMFRVHYNIHDHVTPGPDDIQNFIDAHRGAHAKNVTSDEGVYSSFLKDYGKRILPVGSLPFTCCRPPSPLTPICPFYNHHNLDGTWKDVDDFRAPIYTEPCNKVVKSKLGNVAFFVEQNNFIRFLWECIFFVFTHIILLSFQSDWNENQKPTITFWPGYIILTAWTVLGVCCYYYCEFFTLYSVSTKVSNLFFD